MTPEQIGLLVLFLLVGLLNFAVQALRRRRAASGAEEEPGRVPGPPPVASRPPRPAPVTPQPMAPPPVARRTPTVTSRTADVHLRRAGERRARPRYSAYELRKAVVLAAVLAPPGGLESSGSSSATRV